MDQYHLLLRTPGPAGGPSITDEGLCDYTTPQRLVVDSDTLPLSWGLLIMKTITLEETSLIDVLHLWLMRKLRLRLMVFRWILKALIIWAFGVLLLVVRLLHFEPWWHCRYR